MYPQQPQEYPQQQPMYPPPPQMNQQQQPQMYPPQPQMNQYPPQQQVPQMYPPQQSQNQSSQQSCTESSKKHKLNLFGLEVSFSTPNFLHGIGKSLNHNHNHTKNPYFETKLPIMVKRSRKVGKDDHKNSIYFDHFEQSNLKNEFHTPEVNCITVYHTNNIIIGIECHYQTLGNDSVGTFTNKGNANGNIQTSSIRLDFGEHFTEISGRSGHSIDRLLIKTNRGKTLEVGGTGGSPFQNLLSFGMNNIVSIGGSTREYLDSLYVLYK